MSETISMPEGLSAATSVTEAIEAVTHAPETIATIFESGEKLIYGTVYAAAFAVTFPLALLFAAIPQGNVISRGLADGSADAMSRANSWFGNKSLL